MPTMRALDAAANAIWAMEPAALENLMTIAAREHDVSPEALEAYRAKTLAQAEQATVRNGIAIFSANGPMFKRANLFTAISGATSYETIARDLQVAEDDPKVKAAILALDTPGGEASGAGELAGRIRAFKKPIIAYVSGMGASAGYWLAAACDEIVVDAQAILGSIGVQMAMSKRDDPKGVTTYTFISSQSPMKNADPGSKEGAEHIQGVVDAMASVFVQAVADYRGVSVDTVLSKFGKGGLFVGQDAIKAGLADRVGSFEAVMAELSAAADTKRATKSRAPARNPAEQGLDAHVDRLVVSAVQSFYSAKAAAAASAASAPKPRVLTPEERAEAEMDAVVQQIVEA